MKTWLNYRYGGTTPHEGETTKMTYTLAVGVGIYLAVAALFYGFLLITAKPETSKVFQD